MAGSGREASAGRAAARPLPGTPVRVDAELVVEVLELVVGAEGEAGVAAAGLPPLVRLPGVRAVAVVVREGANAVVVGSAGYDCGTMAPGAALPLGSGLPVTEAVRTHRPVVQGTGPAWVAVPFPVRTRAGALLLSLDAAPPETEAERWRLHRIARGIAEGLRRAAAADQAAADLQVLSARFTPRLPDLPGWQLATRSCARTGGFAGDVALALPDERGGHWLVVADVCGSGPAAAVVSRSVHAAFTALSPYAAGPGDLLRAVDRTLRQVVGPESFVTAAVVRALDGRLEFASAGHPAPVLLTPTGSFALVVEPGPPLALETASDPSFEQASALLPRDGVLLLHTDGLLDRRGAAGPVPAETALLVAGLPLTDVEALADAVLAAADAVGPPGDDCTVLLARRAR